MNFNLFLMKKTTILFLTRYAKQRVRAIGRVFTKLTFWLNHAGKATQENFAFQQAYWNNLLIIASIVFSTGFIFSEDEKVDTQVERATLISAENRIDDSSPISIKVCYNDDDYGLSGRYKTFTDDKLLNTNNWGPSGTDSRYQFVLHNFGRSTITEAALIANGCQIFYAGGAGRDAGTFDPNTTRTFSAAEKAEIKNWASAVDKVLITCQGISAYMGGAGYSGAKGNSNPNSITTVGQNVISGPFGVTSSFNQGGSFQGKFTAYPSTACVLTEDKNGNPTGLLDGVTGDFYFADFDMLSELASLTNNNGISSNTDIFVANLFSSAATIVVEGPTNACALFSCPAGNAAPSLTSGSVSSTGEAVDLSTLFTGTPPNGTALTWHTVDPVADENYIGNSTRYFDQGTVYATFRAHDGSCFSPATPVNLTFNFPDLSVSTSPVSGDAFKGETQTYTVTVVNNGSVTAPEALVKVPIPSDRALVLANPSLGSYSGSSAVWKVGALASGQSETLEITIRIQ